jgi:hypothetical protein
MSGDDAGGHPADEEWVPRYPHEVVVDTVSSNRRLQCVLGAVAAFLLVGAGLLVPAVRSYLSHTGATADTFVVRIAPAEELFGGFHLAVTVSPVLAVLTGAAAGVRLRGSSLSVGLVGATGAGAGFAALVGLFLGAASALGTGTPAPESVLSVRRVHLFGVAAVAVVAGFAGAALADRLGAQ